MKRVILLLLTFSLMGCVAKASSDPNPALYQVGLAQYWILDSIQLARTGNLQASQAWQVSHLAQAQTRLALAEAALTGLNDCNWPDSESPVVRTWSGRWGEAAEPTMCAKRRD